MTPGIVSGISGERNLKKHIERQMGCMAGFLQLFDRQQILTRRRLNSAKRLPNSPAVGLPSPSPEVCPTSPENRPVVRPPLSLQLPVLEVKDGRKTSWKLREAPRLSLDSRAVVDARGKLRPAEICSAPACFPGEESNCSENGEDLDKQRRSPSVVARLMGLEALPSAGIEEPEQTKRAELRRSASESRVSRDISQFTFQQSLSPVSSAELFRRRIDVRSEMKAGDSKLEPPVGSPSRKGFIAQEIFFPDPKQTRSIYDEIENRLRMRGIKDPAKDLETLKQILETLRLKGILHTKPSELQTTGDSSIAAIKLAAKMLPPRNSGTEPPPLHHRSVSPRRPMALDSIPSARAHPDLVRLRESARSPISSSMRRRSINVEGERVSHPQRRITAVHSPRSTHRRLVSDQVSSQSPRNRRPKSEISSNEIVYSTAEDCILRPPSQIDFHRVRMKEQGTGRFLLERCDELLHSIAAITSSSAEMETSADQQPSPVSVLDSSFLAEVSSAKRSIHFKEDHRKQERPTAGPESFNRPEDDIDEYAYVADAVRETSLRRTAAADAFAVLERRHRASGASKASTLRRLLVFDTVTEIVDRKCHASPWDAFSRARSLSSAAAGAASLLRGVWEEVRWLQERSGLTSKVIWEDMAVAAAGEQEWAVPGTEMSDAILHIERQIFKDLMANTIQELAVLGCRRGPTAVPRRKLIL